MRLKVLLVTELSLYATSGVGSLQYHFPQREHTLVVVFVVLVLFHFITIKKKNNQINKDAVTEPVQYRTPVHQHDARSNLI